MGAVDDELAKILKEKADRDEAARAEIRRRNDYAIEAGARADRAATAARERWPAERAKFVSAFETFAAKARDLHLVMNHEDLPPAINGQKFSISRMDRQRSFLVFVILHATDKLTCRVQSIGPDQADAQGQNAEIGTDEQTIAALFGGLVRDLADDTPPYRRLPD